jgi:hypothetical protein
VLWSLKIPVVSVLVPRLAMSLVRYATAVDIHPAAVISGDAWKGGSVVIGGGDGGDVVVDDDDDDDADAAAAAADHDDDNVDVKREERFLHRRAARQLS